MPRLINRAETCRAEGSAGRIMVRTTRINDSSTMISSVIVAARLRLITPEFAPIARSIAAGSVSRSWLKKNGRSSVGGDTSR